MAEKESTENKNQEVKSPKTTKGERKSKKGLLFGLLGTALFAIIIVGFFLLKQGPAPDDPKAKLSYSPSFFISDGGKYTLWDNNGKRLTEDAYETKSDFIAGYAYVKKDGQSAIIREDGVVTVPFGKYGSIESRGGLYLAQDGNNKNYFLLTGAGKQLLSGSDLSIRSVGSGNAFALAETESAYDLFTYAGVHLGTFKKVQDVDAPDLSGNSDFGIFFYNNYNLIFDVRDGRTVASFEGPRYDFEGVADNRTQILLKNSENEDEEKSDYKLLANGKIYDLNECKYYAFTILDYLIGYESYSEIALLNPDYTVAKRANAYIAIKDSKNYAVKNEETGKVEIVRNGETIKTFDENSDLESGVLYEDMYAIESNSKAMFYTLDGNVAIDHEYQEIWSLFNEFHHAVVADKEDEYYLIDNKGNRLTEGTYSRIYQEKGGYELKNSDGNYSIANKKGEVVTDAKYESLYYRSSAVDHNIWTGRYGYEDHDVIDVDNKKVLVEHANVNSFYANYFTVKNSDDKYDYYTYNGVKFYTSES